MSEGKTLYRSASDQMLGGVCAGIADYFEIDPTVVRLVAVLLLLVGNAAILIAYVVLWVVVPEEPAAKGSPEVIAGAAPTGSPWTPGPDSPPPPPPPGVSPANSATSSGEPVAHPVATSGSGRSGRGPVWLGVALVFVGSVLLMQMFVPQVALWRFWPVIIIVAGIIMVLRRGR